MNKSEAIARIARLPGASGITNSSVHFANVNAAKDVWWLDIPLAKLSQSCNPNIGLLLYDHRPDKLYYLVVPKCYFIDNERRLVTRPEKGCVRLELSTDKSRMFRDVRSRGGGVDFSRFLQGHNLETPRPVNCYESEGVITVEREFREWLIRVGFTPPAISYPRAIHKISEHYSRETGSLTDIYSITDISLIKEIALDYGQKGRFCEYGYHHHGLYRAAIRKYKKYVEQRGGYSSSANNEQDREPQQLEESCNDFACKKDVQTSLCSQTSELFPEYQVFGRGSQGTRQTIPGKRIDLLLQHRENNNLLAVELVCGEADLRAFIQISMHLGLLQEQYPDRDVFGLIVAGAIDPRLKLACSVTDRVELKIYRMYLDLEDA